VREEVDSCWHYYDEKERCIFCDIIRQERDTGERVIGENEHFITLAPYAPRFPFEMWLLPKAHGSSYENNQSSIYGSLARMLSPRAAPGLHALVRARAEPRADSLVAGVEALRDRPDRTAELPAIACPTLVLCGADDQITPAAEMRRMAGALPRGRYVELAGAGHLAHLEAPAAFVTATGSFLADVLAP